MEFEFDQFKSRANLEKHGIDFVEAQRLWGDDNRLEADLSHPVEERRLIIGRIEEKFWTAIVTYRLPRIRIISVRRSRKKEVQRYEQVDHY